MGDLLLRPIGLEPDWLELLSLDMLNKGNKKSEQFSVEQKIKGREADDVNVREKYLAKELDVDILVSGHSHQPKIEQKDGVLLLNPGSPIVPRLADRTVMLLEINNKEVGVEVVKIGSPVCSALDFDQYKRD